MARGAEIAHAAGADIIDINIGCPAKRVTNGYAGSALMRVPDEALTLIDAVVAATPLPVTVKMRLGWDDDSLNAADMARRAVDAGVQMITVHGRTRQQFYKGEARWELVRAGGRGRRRAGRRQWRHHRPRCRPRGAGAVRRRSGDDRSRGAGPALGGGADRRRAGGRRAAAAPAGRRAGRAHRRALRGDAHRIRHAVGVRVARKHLDWYLEARGIVLDKPVRKPCSTAKIPAEVAAHDPRRSLPATGGWRHERGACRRPCRTAVLQALPQPVIVCGEDRTIVFVNYAAEAFFGASLSVLTPAAAGRPHRLRLADHRPGRRRSRERRAPMTEYRVRVGSSRFAMRRRADRRRLRQPAFRVPTAASRCCSRSAPWPTRSTGSWSAAARRAR